MSERTAFRVIGRSGPGLSYEGLTIRFARLRDGSPADGVAYKTGHHPMAGARGWPLHPEWDNGQYDILEAVPAGPSAPKKPERCSCPESLLVREELASAAAHIATLLETFVGADDQQPVRRWLAGYQERLP